MNLNRFFSELKRRHVLRVVGAYAFAAWVAVEVYTTIQPILWEEYEWTNRLVVVLALVGFPVTFVLAWVFDITPQGVRRTQALQELPPAADPARGVAAGRAADRETDGSAQLPRRRALTPRAAGFFGLGILGAIVGLAAYAGVQHQRAVAPAVSDMAAIESIAVLPFADMSPNRDQEFFSDGIAEELLNRLAQVPELRVPARTSSFAFKGRSDDVREIGRRLGVQAVLEGSVRRDGDRLRVTVQLIDVGTGFQIWTDAFEGVATNIFGLQDEISNRIVETLRLRFTVAPEAGERGTTNARALDLYYRGMKRWNERTDEGLRDALSSFNAAVREDSTFALAHAAAAKTYAILPAYGNYPADSAATLGMAAAAAALSLDPTLAEAYAALGQLVQNVEWDLRAAEDYYRRALTYKPSYAAAHVWYAETLMMLGELEAAGEQVAAAQAIDPLSPVTLHADAMLRTLAGSADEALAAWRNLGRLHPDFSVGHLHHAYAAFAAGRTEDAVKALQRRAETAPEAAALYAEVIAAVQDRRAVPAARRAIAGSSLSAAELVAWAVIIGDNGLAIRRLEMAAAQHTDMLLPFLMPHPVLSPLRQDPRFRQIAAELDLHVPG